MQEIFERILGQEIFLKNPPVLVDVGASGSVHARFKPLAKASVCVAFDADDLEMHQVVAKDSKDFQKLHVVNSVLSEKYYPEIPFFLTKYPYCSCTLKPYIEIFTD